jgi:two-component sensor histidine kinase/PAS domain-containing protein
MLKAAEIIAREADLSAEDIEWIRDLVREGQLVADLAYGDIAIWVKTTNNSWVAVALFRAGTSSTVFSRDIVGMHVDESWGQLIVEADRRGMMLEPTEPIWFDEFATQVRAIPIRRSRGFEPIAVLTRHAVVADIPNNRQAATFMESADQIFSMIAEGDFPSAEQRDLPKLGAPRASDGFITIDREATVRYASPNALSLFNRMGYSAPLEGTNFADVVRQVSDPQVLAANEMLPMVASGRVPWQEDVRAKQMFAAIRGIPLTEKGERVGAILLLRDVTELRRQERELSSKNATIREIHHRVKNNLQTVASLLRIQGRRSKSDEAKEALAQAMRRIEAIAVVHDTLASGLAQSVNFDEVAARVSPLAAEVASAGGVTIRPTLIGSFGMLPSEFATPLAVVLTELITNAVEHGVPDRADGEVQLIAERGDAELRVTVADNGPGIESSTVGQGLGTQIIKTLVEGELTGTINWARGETGGTRVTINIPLRFLGTANRG